MSLNEQSWLETREGYGKDHCPAAAEAAISLATEAVAESGKSSGAFFGGFAAGFVATAAVAVIALRKTAPKGGDYVRPDASERMI